MSFLELLKQRRIWVAIIGVVTFAFSIFGVNLVLDTEFLTDQAINIIEAVSSIIMAALALWSYFKPKK